MIRHPQRPLRYYGGRMSTRVVQGPAWSTPETGRYIGQNPLAVSRHVAAQSRKFAIAGTSTTFHARYYTLHGLVAAESEDRGLSQAEQINLLRRCEVVLGGVAAAHRVSSHPGMLHIHGINAIGLSLERSGELDLAKLVARGPGGYSRRRWGFLDDYASAEAALGLVSWREGQLTPGPGLDVDAVREGLGGLLDLARRERVALATLEAHSEYCLCQMAQSADGLALRRRLIASETDPMSWEGRSAQTVRMLLRLLDLHGATGNLQADLGRFLLFSRESQEDQVLAGLEATLAWRGLALRDVSVRSWHRLWVWLVDQIDGAMPVAALGDAFANALPACSLGRYLEDLPERLDGPPPHATMLPAEEQVADDPRRSAPDRHLAQILLGALRMDELPTRVAAYFEDPATDGRSRLRPGWIRGLIPEWSHRPLGNFAVFLTRELVSRAQQVALAKARFSEATGVFELPNGVSLRDGLVVCDHRADQSIDVWFRWSAIVRILAGVGLTEEVDGRWRVTEEGRLS